MKITRKKLNQKSKEYRENNKEKIKEYYEANKDKIKDKQNESLGISKFLRLNLK